MHICYVINGLAPAGAEHQLLEIIREVERDVEFTVCHFGWGTALEEKCREAGATVINLNFSIPYDPASITKFVFECVKNDFDIIHAHLPPAMIIGRLAGYITKTPVVSTHHNVSDNYQPVSKLGERISRRIDDRTVAVSNGVKESFNKSDTIQWETIHNGIDIEDFRSNVMEYDADNEIQTDTASADLIFLNIARYSPQKRQKNLIEAFAAVVDDLPSAHLFIVGWGDLREVLEAKAEAEGVSDCVTVTGRVPDVEPYYQAADVFVSSSVREGLPITFLEAMAVGLPILATDIPGVREVVVDEETGLLVDSDRVSTLQDGLVRIATECDLKLMGKNAVQRAQKSFSIQQTVDQHLKLYEDLCGANISRAERGVFAMR